MSNYKVAMNNGDHLFLDNIGHVKIQQDMARGVACHLLKTQKESGAIL